MVAGKIIAPSLFVVLGLASLACSSAPAETGESSAEVNEQAYSPYPHEMRDIRTLGQLDPLNTSIANFGSAARDQGKIASCASHGFLGLIENQLWNDRGVNVDLSERYQLYSNFMHTGNLGSDPKVIE